MATNFPTALDSFSNPVASELLNSLAHNHASVHATINDAIEAIEAKIGIDGSSASDSLDYRLGQIEAVSGAIIVRKTADEWLDQDPDLILNQIGLETDTLKFKFGTGASWTATNYANITQADLDNSLDDYIPMSYWGNPSGVATLDVDGLIPNSQIPSGITRDTELTTHANVTTSVHGIADTSALATKTYADTAAANAAAAIVDSAPSTLNTLNELAAALGDDANYASTVSTALGNKQDKVSGVSDTEIGYLDGVTSSIQTQINGKQDKVSGVSDTEIGYLDGVTSSIQTQLDAKQPIVSGVSNTEIGYLDGVTSAIQTQIDSKASTSYVNLISYGTAVSGTTYTVSGSDLYKLTEFTGSSAVTVTIPSDPSDSTFPIGSTIEFRQMGTGRVGFEATSPAELVAPDNYYKTRTRYSSVILEKRASNSWILTGDIDA